MICIIPGRRRKPQSLSKKPVCYDPSAGTQLEDALSSRTWLPLKFRLSDRYLQNRGCVLKCRADCQFSTIHAKLLLENQVKETSWRRALLSNIFFEWNEDFMVMVIFQTKTELFLYTSSFCQFCDFLGCSVQTFFFLQGTMLHACNALSRRQWSGCIVG